MVNYILLVLQIASQLFEYTWNLWKNDIHTILQSFSTISQSITMNSLVEQGHDLLLVCERWFLCLKIIRQLIISGYPSDITTAQVNMPHFKIFLVCHSLVSFMIKRFLTFYSHLRRSRWWRKSVQCSWMPFNHFFPIVRCSSH